MASLETIVPAWSATAGNSTTKPTSTSRASNYARTITPTPKQADREEADDTTTINNPLHVSSLSSRRPSASQPKPLLRPRPQPPRAGSSSASSSGLHSPRTEYGRYSPSVLSSTSSSRPTSPPRPHPTQRYPSPPLMMKRSSATPPPSMSPTPHPQQSGGSYHALTNQPKPEELMSFAALCRALYYDHDPSAAQAVDQTLQRLPAPSRTAYARTMASVRAQFHRDEEIRRRKLVEDLLDASQPGKVVPKALGVSEGGKGAMRSKKAKAVRRELLEHFVGEYCVKGLPGSQPFFKALYAVLYLQSLPASKGGAGKRRVEWEVDVAVFSEAAGGDWTKDSIEMLKCVLGFTERIKDTVSYFEDEDEDEDPLEPPAPFANGGSTPSSSASSDVEVDEAPTPPNPTRMPNPSASVKRPPPQVPPHRATGSSSRGRAPSDPFSDPKDRRTPVANGPLTTPVTPTSTEAAEGEDTQLLAGTPSSPLRIPSRTTAKSIVPSLSPTQTTISQLAAPKPQYRIFTAPAYLGDLELLSLLSLFPDYIRSRPSFASSAAGTSKVDEESVGASAVLGPSGGEGLGGLATDRVGHGTISVGSELRDEGWHGSGWERFMYWLTHLFSKS